MFIRQLLSLTIKSHNRKSRTYLNVTSVSLTSISRIANQRSMAENVYTGLLLSTILEGLERFAPLRLAESWDNVGLLIDPIETSPIRRVLLTNDLTEAVVEEAVGLKAGLIITYHPNIFQPLKSVSSRTWKERIVVECIKNRIAVFSPHTSWDSAKGGVNDWLASAFAVDTTKPILEKSDNPLLGAGRFITLMQNVSLKEAIENIKKLIGIPYLRLAMGKNKDENSTISSVALCAGAGTSVLKGLRADLYLTGEMLHHDVLDAAQNGINVILCNHSDSERGFLRNFQKTLQNDILQNKAEVFVSQVDCDPLKTV